MDHKKILTRSWEILWAYRVLWIFGIILALTGVGARGSGGNGGNNGGSGVQSEGAPGVSPFSPEWDWRGQFNDAQQELNRFFDKYVPSEAWNWLIVAAVVFIVVILILIVVSTILRFVSETSLIRMVDAYEQSGEKVGFRQGFRLGWSRTAWRLFLIDLLIYLPATIIFLVLLLAAATPLLVWASGDAFLGAAATVASIGLLVLIVFVFAVAMVAVSLVLQFIRRACALESLGVIASIRRGWQLVRSHLKDSVLMGLIVVGLRIVFGLATIVVLLPLILVGALLGGATGLIFGGLSSFAASGALPWIVGTVIGAPIFLAILIIPMLFLQGLYLTYMSTTWTLSYRELHALESLAAPETLPVEPEAGAAEATLPA